MAETIKKVWKLNLLKGSWSLGSAIRIFTDFKSQLKKFENWKQY